MKYQFKWNSDTLFTAFDVKSMFYFIHRQNEIQFSLRKCNDCKLLAFLTIDENQCNENHCRMINILNVKDGFE